MLYIQLRHKINVIPQCGAAYAFPFCMEFYLGKGNFEELMFVFMFVCLLVCVCVCVFL